WTPWYEGKPQVQSRVISRRGSVSELDESTLTESTLGQLSEGILSDDNSTPIPQGERKGSSCMKKQSRLAVLR
ncbi:MAG: hypothetical protein AB8B55_04860, partial [Mariniblastus sp.]